MQRSMHETAVGFAHNKGILLREYLLKALKKRSICSETDIALRRLIRI
jgi:hypothetical protein